MRPTDELRSDEALDDAAVAWLCEREAGFTPERARAFARWCERDPRHAAAIVRVERALAMIREMPAIRAPLETKFGRTGSGGLVRSVRGGRLLRFPLSLAAAAAALMVGVACWWSLASRPSGSEHFSSEAGVQRSVALRDGSLVDLNRASEMRVAFTANERRVDLATGEAHFQVTPDPARPFIVVASGITVQAIGTAFSVRITEGAVEVLVVEGKVEVVRETSSRSAPAVARPRLGAGERLHMPRDDRTVPAVERVDPTAVRALLAWQDRLSAFTDVPLREVIERLNRRNATQIVIEDAELRERKMGGVIALDQVEAFVRLLEQDGDVVSHRRGPNEVVLRRIR